MLVPQDGIVLHTIGHSNVSLEQIIQLLGDNWIEVLVDVRTVPRSRYAPQFNQADLAEVLSKIGFEYRFAGDTLGGRPKDQTCYKRHERPQAEQRKAKYLRLVDYEEVAKRPWYKKAIADLIETAVAYRVAIMCSEEDPYKCHRQHLITRSLLKFEEAKVTVWHIRGNGDLERAILPPQMSLFDDWASRDEALHNEAHEEIV